MSRRPLLAALVLLAVAGCSDPPEAEPVAAAFDTVTPDVLTACVAPTPQLVESGDGGLVGYDVEVLEHVAAALGVPLALEEVPYDDLLSGVALNGLRCDVAAGGILAADVTAGIARSSVPYRTVDRVVVALGEAVAAPVAPGAVAGTVAVEEGGVAEGVADQLTGAELVRFPSGEDLRRALGSGAVDAALLTAAEAVALAAEAEGVVTVARVPSEDRTVLLLAQAGDEELLTAVDEALDAWIGSEAEAAAVAAWLAG